MNQKFPRCAAASAHTSLAAAVLALAGCGGGGDSTSTTPPATQSISGVVIDGAIKGATVCLDLNKNGACDADEPASSATDALGNYTISGLTLAQVNAGAPLIAVIPTSAVDASNPTGTVGKAYRLGAPTGKGAVISPISTLVQAGVAQSMTLADAEAAVAAQLQVGVPNLYNNYTTSSTGDNATLASVVPTIVSALQAGVPLLVSAPTASAASYSIRSLRFTDQNNYFLRYYYSTNVPSSTGLYTYYDERTSLSLGNPVAAGTLYDSALLGTVQGWVPVTGATANTNTGGSPNVSNYGGGYTYVSTRVDTDVAGMAIADVVKLAQDMTVNTESTIVGVDPSKLTGTMPAGAKVRKIASVATAAPVSYRVSDGFVGASVTALPGVVTAYPVPATPAAANTLSMGGLHGSAGCGSTVCSQERLRVAFASSNATTYFLCDIDTSTNIQSNCNAVGTGTYALGKAADNATPIMTFSGLPAATSVQTFTRVFVERSGHVYFGFRDKLIPSTQTRLNKIAFEALAATLGIVPPTISELASPFAGVWNASYTGSDVGSCPAGIIDALGHISGSCTSAIVGQTFVVSGTVTAAGVAAFTASGGSSTGATFTGALSATSGSGSWSQPAAGGSGFWTATKQ